MTIMFERSAHNYAKAGYFPTDDATLAMIKSFITPSSGVVDDVVTDGVARIFDPCCGDAGAVLQLATHLGVAGAVIETFGVEFDQNRAYLAKAQPGITQAVHSDLNDVVVPPRAMSCLFLNPPYGEVTKDGFSLNADIAPAFVAKQRIEKHFFDRTFTTLAMGGLLVLIVPVVVVDEDFALKIFRNFESVRWFMAPEKRFNQAVFFGVRTASKHPAKADVEQLLNFVRVAGETRDSLGVEVKNAYQKLPKLSGESGAYSVPALSSPQPVLRAARIDAKQLSSELTRLGSNTLWSQFHLIVQTPLLAPLPWLCEPSTWHLALALSAGHVQGVVTSVDGRVLLIKGGTAKSKTQREEVTTEADGSVTSKIYRTDVFVPRIRGIDFTLRSAMFGAIVSVV